MRKFIFGLILTLLVLVLGVGSGLAISPPQGVGGGGGAGGAPTGAYYYVSTVDGTLTNEIVPAEDVRNILAAADNEAIKALLFTEFDDNEQLLLVTYSTAGSKYTRLRLRKSDANDETLSETDAWDYLGILQFEGCNTTPAFAAGSRIWSRQTAAADVYVPSALYLSASDDTNLFSDQFVLSDDYRVGVGIIETENPLAAFHVQGTVYVALTGTVTATNGSPNIEGAGTDFVGELVEGCAIRIASNYSSAKFSEIFTVDTITDGDTLILDSNYLGDTSSGLSAWTDGDLFKVSDGEKNVYFTIDKKGNIPTSGIFTNPIVGNSDTSAGSVFFREDTDNGTNAVQLKGPDATADVILNLQAIAGTIYSSGGTDVAVADGGTNSSTALNNDRVMVSSGGAIVESVVTTTELAFLDGIISALDRNTAAQPYTSSGNITEAHILANKYLTNQGASGEIDLVLPDLEYYVNVIFIVNEAFIIEINPPNADAHEAFDLDGTVLDASDCIDSSTGIGDKISATRMQIADGSWKWSLDTIRGVWIDTGASD